MLIDAWATTQKIQEDTGMTVDQILALPADEYARLSGRHTPAEAAVAAYGASVPRAHSGLLRPQARPRAWTSRSSRCGSTRPCAASLA
jgi:hypothetical protein